MGRDDENTVRIVQSRRLILLAVCVFFLGNPPIIATSTPIYPDALKSGGEITLELQDTFEFQEALSITIDRTTQASLKLAKEITCSITTTMDQQGADPFRVVGLIKVESYGNPKAKSPKGALGLMQIMPPTGRVIARDLGVKWEGPSVLLDVHTNVTFGTWYYYFLVRKFEGDEHAALAAYNWGPATINGRIRRGERLPQVYPAKVVAAQEEVERVFRNEYQKLLWRRDDKSRGFPGIARDTRGHICSRQLATFSIGDAEGMEAGERPTIQPVPASICRGGGCSPGR